MPAKKNPSIKTLPLSKPVSKKKTDVVAPSAAPATVIHPMSPKDTTPIVVFGSVTPNPSIVEEEEEVEDEEDDEVIVPTLNPLPSAEPEKEPEKEPEEEEDEEEEEEQIIPTLPVASPPVAMTPLRTSSSALKRVDMSDSSDDEEYIQPAQVLTQPKKGTLASMRATPSPSPTVHKSPPPSPPPPQPQPPPPQPKSRPPPTTTTSPLPSGLVTGYQYRTHRPDKLPEYEFFTYKTAEEQLTPADYYEALAYYEERCNQIFKTCPTLPPPKFITNGRPDTPALAKVKTDRYEQQANIRKRAFDIGNFIFIIIGGIEYVLTRWFGMKFVSGLFQMQQQNKADYMEALIEMGQTVMSWFQGSMSAIWRMLFVFFASLIALIGTNYLIDYLVPENMRGQAHNFKQKGIKYIQDMASMLFGYKDVDAESSQTGNVLMNIFSQLFGVNTASSGQAPAPSATRPPYAE